MVLQGLAFARRPRSRSGSPLASWSTTPSPTSPLTPARARWASARASVPPIRPLHRSQTRTRRVTSATTLADSGPAITCGAYSMRIRTSRGLTSRSCSTTSIGSGCSRSQLGTTRLCTVRPPRRTRAHLEAAAHCSDLTLPCVRALLCCF